jgi:hypothetical protein
MAVINFSLDIFVSEVCLRIWMQPRGLQQAHNIQIDFVVNPVPYPGSLSPGLPRLECESHDTSV